jgi:aminoglycoside phosphotransferase (APT) family kinase protein
MSLSVTAPNLGPNLGSDLGPRPGVLAPDELLPQRDRLLDPREIGDWFKAEAELLRVKYRVGESLRVLYRLIGHDGDVPTSHGKDGRGLSASRLVAARTFAPGDLTGMSARAAGHGPAEAAPYVDQDRSAVWWTFPGDRRIVSAARFVAAGGSVVQYAPEKSVTLRLGSAAQPRGFAKVYAPGTVDPRQLAQRYELVAGPLTAVGFGSPRVADYGADWLVLEVVSGRSWLEQTASDLTESMIHIGRAIATVHQIQPAEPQRSGLRRFGRLSPARLRRSADVVGRALPEHAALASRLADRLLDTPPSPSATVLLHGDCHPGNVLVGDRVSLIDLDQAGLGHPAADVASLIARLEYGAAVGEQHGEVAGDLADAFLAGYAEIRPLPSHADLRWHTAAALLAERALRAVNRVRPEGLAVVGQLLATAQRILDEPTADLGDSR